MINELKVRSLVLALGLFFAGTAHAATITVTGTGDTVAVDGLVTLREAITSINAGANTSDVIAVGAYGTSDTINFAIPGAGAHVIAITSALPSIIKPVTINGYTQGPGTANSAVTGNNSVHNLVIDGTGAGAGVDGLTLAAGSSGSTIRGLVIDSFGLGNGILINNSKNNIIAGNFIGTDNNGGFNAAAANNVGVSLFAFAAGDDISGNQIGGSTPADRNVLSNNTSREIALFGVAGTTTTGILVQNNYLGMNAAGTTAIGGGQGVLISGIQGATIGGASGSLGGSCSGVCNLIAGSTGSSGLAISDATSSGNLIQGNFFGTDVTGTLARSNGSAANINIGATSTVTIGGTVAGTGNLISGENAQGKGILIDSGVVGPVNIQGNFIGTTTTGNATLGNGGAGISITGSTNVNIGGTTAAARNVIGGNGNGGIPKLPGILLEGNGPANATAVIQGNNIGIGADGTSNVGNIGNGIDFTAGSTGSTVGASTSGGLGGNIIAFNGAGRTNGAGVAVAGGNQARIFSNSIFSNTGITTGIGIDLSATGSATDGPTANDACDGDTGGNSLQNFPVLTSAQSTGSSITMVGTLNSTASTTFTVEFFSNSSGSQGRTFLGSTSTTTNGACSGSFNTPLVAAVSAGLNITATATDPSGNTSEFSAAVVSTAAATAADAAITGHIADGNGNPLEGVAIRLSGTQNRLTITDAQGNYHFDNVETDGLYTVTPSRANFAFGPTQRSFTALGQHTDATFSSTSTGGNLNPLDTTEYFVRQQYVDFLDREPDEAGLNFWVNNIQSCGADAQCTAGKRIDTSAAFFLSIEFQQTGYLVYRIYQAAYGDIPGAPIPVRLGEFRTDTQQVHSGVIVNQNGWQTVLESNKQAFATAFVQRGQFLSTYPTALNPTEFVDKLLTTAGVTLPGSEGAAAITEFGGTATSADTAARAKALRRVADNSQLVQREFDSAFVLLEYFGYLRRDPNSSPDTNFAGYDFWLTKLDGAQGNYQNADMVKAFLIAAEYRQRFPR